MNKGTKRVVGEQSQGFRYQKQRVVQYIMDALVDSNEFFFAIEYFDDVFGKIYKKNSISIIAEQDKHYDKNTSFSFSSSEIYKSIINYLEHWLNNERTNAIRYIFVSTNKVAKEKQTDKLTELGITLPQKPLLTLISERKYINDNNLLTDIVKFIKYQYKEMYKDKVNESFINEISTLTNDDWIIFFNKIDYLFEQDNIVTLEKECLSKIKESKFFDKIKHKGKEEYINSRIIDLLDKKQSQDWPSNFITFPEIKIIFLELASQEQTKPYDPNWDSFDNEELKDVRSMEEKIFAVCPSYNVNKLKQINRRIASSIKEEQFSNKQCFLSQKYKIFLSCSELILKTLLNKKKFEFTESEIDSVLDKLLESSSNIIQDLSNTYNYPYNNKETIKGMIFNLFNECYLSFEINKAQSDD